MRKEALYYFIPSGSSSLLLNELLRLKAEGERIGFTYPKANTHTCFNSEQEAKLDRIIQSFAAEGLEFERAPYYRGDLAGEDFGISTFRQPVVQWCPSPIASARDRSIFERDEPWGLTTDGQVVIATRLRETIGREVLLDSSLQPEDLGGVISHVHHQSL